MSHVQDRLRSISKAFKTFDTKQASFAKPTIPSPQRSVAESESAESQTSAAVDSIGSTTTPPVVMNNPPTAAAAPVVDAPKKNKTIFWIVLVVIVLLVIFGLVLYALYKKRKRAPDAKQKPSADPFRQIEKIESRPPKPNESFISATPRRADEEDDEKHDDGDTIPV